jgi:hypothetical protein
MKILLRDAQSAKWQKLEPHFDHERKVLYVNGLYPHGFSLTPTVVEEVLALLAVQESSLSTQVAPTRSFPSARGTMQTG